MSQANLDLGIFQGINLTGGFYVSGSAGYSVVATDAPIQHCFGVAVFYRLSLQYAMESIQQFRPNVIGSQLATGEWRWYIIGCYLDPDDTSTIESAVAAFKERPGFGAAGGGGTQRQPIPAKGTLEGG